MKMTDGHTLLSLYARTGSDSAFQELVTRYLDLVYSTAFRLVGGDAESAQDVTQTVFVALAEKARTLPKDVMLGGWLHQHTRFVAGEFMRTERRRQLRERQAAEMNAIEDHTESNLAQVAPVLDDAIGELDADDRTAILLRFFEQKDFRSVGEALGSSEDAARKRVDRALEKLHVLLKHRGATLSLAALGSVLATEAVTAAPAGLAGSVAATALASAAAGAGMTATLVKLMTMTKVKLGIIGAVAVAGVATPLAIRYQYQSSLRETNQVLRQQAQQLEQQQTENERLSNLLAQANASQLSASNQLNELLKLRGEVGALREQKMEWDRTGAAVKANRQAEGVGASAIPARIPRESWAFAGYSSPEAALESVVWAMSKGDLKTLLASATAEAQRLLAQQYAAKSAGEIAASLTEEASGLPELALDSKVVLADGTVSFTIAVFDAEKGDTRIHDEAVMHFENVGGEWKYSLRSGVRGAGTNSDQGGGHN